MAVSKTDAAGHLQAHSGCVFLSSLHSLKLRCFLFCLRATSSVGDHGGDWPQWPVVDSWPAGWDDGALELIIKSLMRCFYLGNIQNNDQLFLHKKRGKSPLYCRGQP